MYYDHCWSVLSLMGLLGEPRLYHSLHQSRRQRFVHWEVDCSFGGLVPLEFVLERFDHGRTREQTAMVRERGEPHERAVIHESWDAIADGLGGLGRHGGPNRLAHQLQGAARGFWDGSQVIFHSLRCRSWCWSAAAFRG